MKPPPYLLAYYYHYFMVHSGTSVKSALYFQLSGESPDSACQRNITIDVFGPLFNKITSGRRARARASSFPLLKIREFENFCILELSLRSFFPLFIFLTGQTVVNLISGGIQEYLWCLFFMLLFKTNPFRACYRVDMYKLCRRMFPKKYAK